MASHRLTRDQIAAYADLSHDHNPLHVDDAFAAASPFGGVIAHGFLVLGGALNALGAAETWPKSLEVRFQSPGRPGDLLDTRIDVDGTFEVSVDGRTVATGRLSPPGA